MYLNGLRLSRFCQPLVRWENEKKGIGQTKDPCFFLKKGMHKLRATLCKNQLQVMRKNAHCHILHVVILIYCNHFKYIHLNHPDVLSIKTQITENAMVKGLIIECYGSCVDEKNPGNFLNLRCETCMEYLQYIYLYELQDGNNDEYD